MKKFKKNNLEKQMHNLPNEVKWCKLCTISNQRPKIVFKERTKRTFNTSERCIHRTRLECSRGSHANGPIRSRAAPGRHS